MKKIVVSMLALSTMALISACGGNSQSTSAETAAAETTAAETTAAESKEEASEQFKEASVESEKAEAGQGEAADSKEDADLAGLPTGEYYYIDEIDTVSADAPALPKITFSKSGDDYTMTISDPDGSLAEALGLSGSEAAFSVEGKSIQGDARYAGDVEIDGQAFSLMTERGQAFSMIYFSAKEKPFLHFVMTHGETWPDGFIGEYAAGASLLTVDEDGAVAYTDEDGVSYTGKLGETIPALPLVAVPATADDGTEVTLALIYDADYSHVTVTADEDSFGETLERK